MMSVWQLLLAVAACAAAPMHLDTDAASSGRLKADGSPFPATPHAAAMVLAGQDEAPTSDNETTVEAEAEADDAPMYDEAGFEITKTPLFQAADLMYVRKKSASTITITFDSIDQDHLATIKLRGGGYWDEEVDCVNVNLQNVTCELPSFPLSGQVSMMVQFGRNTIDPSPFFPLDHYVVVHAVDIVLVTPNLINRLSTGRTLRLTTQGLFRDTERTGGTNMWFELRSGRKVLRPNFNYTGPFAANITLPRQIDTGVWVPYVTVDGGITFTGGQAGTNTSLTVYEPRFADDRLLATPNAGPVVGGTPVAVDGLYGVIVTKGALLVKLENTIINIDGNETTTSVTVAADLPVNKDKPVLSFNTVPVPRPGYYSVSFSEIPTPKGVPRQFTPIPSIMFLYYDFAVEALAPVASTVFNPSRTVTFYASEFPRTGKIVLRWGEARTTPDGATYVYDLDVQCPPNYGDLQEVPSSDDTLPTTTLEAITCDLPEMGTVASKNTILTMALSVNGVDFTVPLPYNEFTFYDATAETMLPAVGPGQGGNVVTVFGSGFTDLPGMCARIDSTNPDTAPRIVPLTFEGEGMVSFIAPPAPSGESDANETVVVTLLLDGDSEHEIVVGPVYTYANAIPVLTALALDAGNRFSDRIAVVDNDIYVRVSAAEPLTSVDVLSFTIGNDDRSAYVSAAPLGTPLSSIINNNNNSRNSTATTTTNNNNNTNNTNNNTNGTDSESQSDVDPRTWVLRYKVQEGDVGDLTFSLACENSVGNLLSVTDSDPLADKTLAVDGTTPSLKTSQVEMLLAGKASRQVELAKLPQPHMCSGAACPHETCAVVNPVGTLLDGKRGGDIDAHQVVVRPNLYDHECRPFTDGGDYRAHGDYVGTKTTHSIVRDLGDCTFTNPLFSQTTGIYLNQWEGEKGDEICAKTPDPNRCVVPHTLDKVAARAAYGYDLDLRSGEKCTAGTCRLPCSDPFAIPGVTFDYPDWETTAPAKDDAAGCILTAGAYAVLWAMQNCRKTTIFGYYEELSPCAWDPYYYHSYGDQDEMMKDRSLPVHRLDAATELAKCALTKEEKQKKAAAMLYEQSHMGAHNMTLEKKMQRHWADTMPDRLSICQVDTGLGCSASPNGSAEVSAGAGQKAAAAASLSGQGGAVATAQDPATIASMVNTAFATAAASEIVSGSRVLSAFDAAAASEATPGSPET